MLINLYVHTHVYCNLYQGLLFLDFLLSVWDKHKFREVSIESECTNWLQLFLEMVDITGDHPDILLRLFFGKITICKKYRKLIVREVCAVEHLFACMCT